MKNPEGLLQNCLVIPNPSGNGDVGITFKREDQEVTHNVNYPGENQAVCARLMIYVEGIPEPIDPFDLKYGMYWQIIMCLFKISLLL